MKETENRLLRRLSSFGAVSIVIGTVIGTGIFLKTSVIAQNVQNPYLILVIWIFAGFLALAGALSYAELGAMIPDAGGDYVFLNKAYGEGIAFVYGWIRFFLTGGSIAAYGAAFSIFMNDLININYTFLDLRFSFLNQEIFWQFGLKQLLAVSVILFFSGINLFGVLWSGNTQIVLAAAKLLGILAIIFGVFLFSGGMHENSFSLPAGTKPESIKLIGAGILAALWAYSGWQYLPMASGEIKNPGRNIPLALILGMILVILIYSAINLAFLYALPYNELVTSNSAKYPDSLSIAVKASKTFLGTGAVKFISLIFIISTIGALNGTILTCTRVPYAMAIDKLFFQKFGEIGKKSYVPAWAIILFAAWASLLSVTGTFDQLTNLVVFTSSIFLVFTVLSVFILRKKYPHLKRPYRTLGYPIIPALYIFLTLGIIVNTLQTNPVESAVGLFLILLGIPFYFFFKRNRARIHR